MYHRTRLALSAVTLASLTFTVVIPAPAALATTSLQTKDAVVPAPTFYPNHFQGMGDIAIIYGNNGLEGGDLFTVVNHVIHGKSVVTAQRIASRASAATFSPNGQWLAVTTAAPQGQTLWLMAATGGRRQKIASDVWDPTWLPSGSELLYSHGSHMYKVTPGSRPQQLLLKLPPDSVVDGISVATRGEPIALDVTQNQGDYNTRYDEIGLWNAHTGAFTPLVKATAPNGLVVGPFTGHGKTLLYWDDPDHSASLLADGATLHAVAQNETPETIGHTFASAQGAQPFGADQVLLWQTHSRYLFAGPQTLAIWHGPMVPSIAHGVELSPTVSANGQSLAFVYGLSHPNMVQGPTILRWMTTLKLATFSLTTHRLTTLSTAGSGTMDPLFNASGTKVIFTRGNDVMWTLSNDRGSAVPVVTLPGAALQGYPQYGAILYSVQIADYLPAVWKH